MYDNKQHEEFERAWKRTRIIVISTIIGTVVMMVIMVSVLLSRLDRACNKVEKHGAVSTFICGE